MEARAVAKHIRMSPRKVRLVVDQIRGRPVDEAYSLLQFSKKAAAVPVGKTLRSAVANTDPPPAALRVNQRLIRPLQDFLRKEVSAGILLVIAAAVALVWANSPWGDSYFDLWSTEAAIEIGSIDIHLTIKGWVKPVKQK